MISKVTKSTIPNHAEHAMYGLFDTLAHVRHLKPKAHSKPLNSLDNSNSSINACPCSQACAKCSAGVGIGVLGEITAAVTHCSSCLGIPIGRCLLQKLCTLAGCLHPGRQVCSVAGCHLRICGWPAWQALTAICIQQFFKGAITSGESGGYTKCSMPDSATGLCSIVPACTPLRVF